MSTSFLDGARILEGVLLTSPANHESLRTGNHAVALQVEADNRQAATEGMAVRNMPDPAAAVDEHRPIVMLDGAYIRIHATSSHGQRHRAGKATSTSRAEGTVNPLINARTNKRRKTHRSPEGAHRVLQVRAAVLDGRFGHQAIQFAA